MNRTARIALKILARAELNRVHEDTDDHDCVFTPGFRGQAEVPGVERAHGRNKSDREALAAPLARCFEHRAGIFEYGERAIRRRT